MRSIDHLIPSKRNKFHPTSLKPVGLIIIVAILLIIPFIYNVTTAGKMQVLGYASNISVSDLYALTNTQRSSNGVGALSLNGALNNAAYAKAQDMFNDNYWAHTAPDGATPWSFISAAGYDWQNAGENLAKNFDTSNGVINGWMNSSTHRSVMLNSGYTDVGFAVMDGTLLGEQVTLVVAMYAVPKASQVQAAPAPQTTNTVTPAAPTAVEPATPIPTPEEQAPVVTEPQVSKIDTQTAPAATTQPIKQGSDSNGEVEGAFIELPVKAYQSLNWGQKATLFIVSVLGLLFILKHTLIWRQHRRNIQHIWLRAHPLSQAFLLAVVVIVTLASGAGVVL